MYYTYILISESTGKLYIGQTNNLKDRINRHNSGQSEYTKNRGPWKPVFATTFKTRSEAILLESKLKGFKSKVRVLEWIERNPELNIL